MHLTVTTVVKYLVWEDTTGTVTTVVAEEVATAGVDDLPVTVETVK